MYKHRHRATRCLRPEPHVQVQDVTEDEVRSERSPAEPNEAEVGCCALRLLYLDAAEILVDQRLQS